MYSDITVHPFVGSAIKAYLSSVARLRVEVFREYPFLQERTLDEESDLLKKYAQSPEAILVIVFDGSKIVGASTGIPFKEEAEWLQKPFLDLELDPSLFFFFTESLLLKPYRGRGIGHHFFDLRENHVSQLGNYSQICFSAIDRSPDHPYRPQDYLLLHDFWKKRGYTHRTELQTHFSSRDFYEDLPSTKMLSFWTKELP
jgi:GNAT superfamily N-acetyltransferase